MKLSPEEYNNLMNLLQKAEGQSVGLSFFMASFPEVMHKITQLKSKNERKQRFYELLVAEGFGIVDANIIITAYFLQEKK